MTDQPDEPSIEDLVRLNLEIHSAQAFHALDGIVGVAMEVLDDGHPDTAAVLAVWSAVLSRPGLVAEVAAYAIVALAKERRAART